MADNYLEKKFEELRSGDLAARHYPKDRRSSHKSLSDLLLLNRSCRGYDKNHTVSEEELKEIISVNTRIPSAMNQQVLRFRPVTGDEAKTLSKHIHLGAKLPELHLPFQDTEPGAFIIICSTAAENRWIDIDLGISAQSMLLRAVDMGLNGICIGAFDKKTVSETFRLEYEPLLLLAIGKGIEKYQLLNIREEECHDYYRKENIHYIPKVRLDDLILP